MRHEKPLKKKRPAPLPAAGPAVLPSPVRGQARPTEPAEVLGRHGNTGQKDHKGAR